MPDRELVPLFDPQMRRDRLTQRLGRPGESAAIIPPDQPAGAPPRRQPPPDFFSAGQALREVIPQRPRNNAMQQTGQHQFPPPIFLATARSEVPRLMRRRCWIISTSPDSDQSSNSLSPGTMRNS